MRFFMLLSLLSLSAYGQHSSQPEKESSNDLRSGTVMFSLQDVEDELTYWLERTPSEDYFLRMKKNKEEKLQKLSSKDAKKLDQEFSAKFLKCAYELPPSPEGCQASLRLNMKGEQQDICGKDDKKTQEFSSFARDLRKRF